jgi:cobalt-zinc-cadmium efflux system outer membrane protein
MNGPKEAMTTLSSGIVALTVVSACLLGAGDASAQAPVSRRDAVMAAQQRGSRWSVARADSLAAEAQRRIARALPNPSLSLTYSDAVPKQHVILEVPLDAPWLRGPRIQAADLAGDAARARYVYERAAIRFEAESLYTRAAQAEARARLSQRSSVDAESLLTLARLRRDAGDASDLDVAVAELSAGQLANTATDDSLERVAAVLDLQRVMGMRADSIAIALTDTLAPPADTAMIFGLRPTLPVVAATAGAAAARALLRLEHRGVFSAPSLQVGFERLDPSQPGILPTFGIALPLPLFDRRGGNIGVASAEVQRADAELDLAQREAAANLARGNRERAAALARVRRDSRLLASAERVFQLSLLAYREGAYALPAVLEAARNAREAFSRYIDDVATALTADASLRWQTVTMETP